MEYQHQHYLIGGAEHVSSASPDYQEKMALAYQFKKPLNCLCNTDEHGVGALCYIAKIKTQKEGVKYIVKRLPETGEQHAPTCEHYGLPETLSGKALLSKDAIVEDPNTGMTNIKISMPFAKKLGNPMSMGTGAVSLNVGNKGDTTTKIQSSQLNLIGLLHYILDSAQLNRWSPKMMGDNNRSKRYYGLVYFLFMRTVGKTIAKKQSLADRFFMPQQFHPKNKEACNKAYFDFKQSLKPSKTKAPMGIFVGQFKSFEQGYNCGKLLVGHLSQSNALCLSSMDVVEKIITKHDEKFGLAQVYHEDLTLFFIATVYYQYGELWVESIDFQLMSKEWMPISGDADSLRLNQQLIQEQRYFQTPMRFTLSKDKPLAETVLTDVGNESVPLFFEHNVMKPVEDDDEPLSEPETMGEEPPPEYAAIGHSIGQPSLAQEHTRFSFHQHTEQGDISSLEQRDSQQENSQTQGEYIELPINALVINANQERWALPKKEGRK